VHGEHYGMTHNDAHLGNILVRETLPNYKSKTSVQPQNNLTLIDYGRVFFFDVKPGMPVIQERIHFEVKKYGDADYGMLRDYPDLLYMKNYAYVGIKAFQDTTSECQEFFKSKVFLFDIAAICMNICVLLHQRNELEQLVPSNILRFKDDDGQLYIKVARASVIEEAYNPQENSILYVGIWWFSLFCSSLGSAAEFMQNHNMFELEANATKSMIRDQRRICKYNDRLQKSLLPIVAEGDTKYSSLVINFTNMVDIGIFHYYFQVIEVYNAYWEGIMAYIEKGNFKKMLSNLQIPKSQVGSAVNKRQKRRSVADPSHEQKTSIRKVNMEYFEKKNYLWKSNMTVAKQHGGSTTLTSFSNYYNEPTVSLTPNSESMQLCRNAEQCKVCNTGVMDFVHSMVKHIIDVQKKNTI
jgi:hypothetical protein